MTSPNVTRAIEALSAWGKPTRQEARTLLATWKHRNTLTPAEVREVLRSFGR